MNSEQYCSWKIHVLLILIYFSVETIYCQTGFPLKMTYTKFSLEAIKICNVSFGTSCRKFQFFSIAFILSEFCLLVQWVLRSHQSSPPDNFSHKMYLIYWSIFTKNLWDLLMLSHSFYRKLYLEYIFYLHLLKLNTNEIIHKVCMLQITTKNLNIVTQTT